jgi:hypothetical protein
LFSASDDGVLTAQATAGFRADDVNTYIYARFLGDLNAFSTGIPLKSANVQVCDLDVPRPAGDDAKIPETGDHEVITAKFITTVSTSFQPPTQNDILANGSTGFDGRVMFALSPNQLVTSAGKVTTVTTTERIAQGGHQPGSARTETKSLTERFPDLFFRVTGSNVNADTLHTPNGFYLNFKDKRLGAPASPLTLHLPMTLSATLSTQFATFAAAPGQTH